MHSQDIKNSSQLSGSEGFKKSKKVVHHWITLMHTHLCTIVCISVHVSHAMHAYATCILYMYASV